MNEFDRFVRHQLKPKAYVRYGDDFLVFSKSLSSAQSGRKQSALWLNSQLRLSIHSTNDHVFEARNGAHFLGHWLFPFNLPVIDGVMKRKIDNNLAPNNIATYKSMLGNEKQRNKLSWLLLEQLDVDD